MKALNVLDAEIYQKILFTFILKGEGQACEISAINV